MDTEELFLKYVLPSIGLVLSGAMFASSLPAIIRADKTQDLGALNPFPYVTMVFSCVGWVVYGMFTPEPTNIYCVLGNGFGFICGLYSMLVTFNLTTKKRKDLILRSTLFLATIFTFVFFFVGYYASTETARITTGSLSTAVLLLYYAAPLTSLLSVVRERNSSSIYIPLSICSGVSASLWTGFGFFVQDYFIALPNLWGVILAVIQIVLRIIYPSSTSKAVSTAPITAKGKELKVFVAGDQEKGSTSELH